MILNFFLWNLLNLGYVFHEISFVYVEIIFFHIKMWQNFITGKKNNTNCSKICGGFQTTLCKILKFTHWYPPKYCANNLPCSKKVGGHIMGQVDMRNCDDEEKEWRTCHWSRFITHRSPKLLTLGSLKFQILAF